ncbi:SDR family oxidoreductase [Sphaerisporangium fuscum]|uniref:SDR family oxidoreductase n=1 Tax=Sphaerisporangium fuscum TaxID=2835868 RepID=UPI001BDBB209|nr:NAD(P)H-binding protein [Sphaerisporangium fuscum]
MIVVTGASGNVGRALVQALAEAGEQVTAVSRNTTQVPDGVRHVRADLESPQTLREALNGADALFLLTAGDDPHAILDLAEAGGVRRVVHLSSQGAGTRPEMYPHPRAFEEAVRNSGLDWTILQPGGFFTNSYMWAEPIRAHRTAAAPFGDVALPFIDPADIGEVAAAVLREAGHTGRTYVLTGPAPVTPRERAQAIGDALGEPVEFVEQTREEARAQMVAFMPEIVADGTLTILGEPTDAERQVSPDVERVLGCSPRDFADWARRNAAVFK